MKQISRRGLAAVIAGSAATAAVADHVLERATAPAAPAHDVKPPDGSELSAVSQVLDGRNLSRTWPMGLSGRQPAFGALIGYDLPASTRRDQGRSRSTATRWLRALAGIADEVAPGRSPAEQSAGLDLRAASVEVMPGFTATGVAAFGARVPAAMVDLPPFASDALDPRLCGGDLVLEIGAEDPMRLAGVWQAVQAASAAAGLRQRWRWQGFLATTAALGDPVATRRNLMGHRDGTANPPVGSPLWQSTVVARSPNWMAGGSYLVARRIRIDLARWYGLSMTERDRVIGRQVSSGAALGATTEAEPVDLAATTAHGEWLIPAHAHIRAASALSTAGARLYRRAWNYDDSGPTGDPDAGLLFLGWQADPRMGFLPIQQSMDRNQDALNSYLTHVGSVVAAVPARGEDEYVGQRLLEA